MKNTRKVIIINFILLILIASVIIINHYRTKPVKEERITISFNTNGGKRIASKTIEKGETIKLPTTEKEGYKFGGWYLKNEKVPNETKFYKNVTLVAYWIQNDAETFTITFDTDGGSKIEPLIIECNRDLKLPVNPTKENNEFISWIDSKDNVVNNESKLPCEDITLKAKWKEKTTEKKEEPTPTEIKKEYTCPEGYTLEGTKCITEMAVNQKCPPMTKHDNGMCIMLDDYTEGLKTCNKTTIIIDDTQIEASGEYYKENNEEYCGYYPQEFSQNDCSEEVGVWSNNKCYTKVIKNNYTTSCSDEYMYYSNTDLQNKFGISGNSGCYGIFKRIKSCQDDYVLTDGKCIKTIDAEEKIKEN